MIERATTTVRSSSWVSVRPDIPIFVTTLSPSRDNGSLEELDESPATLTAYSTSVQQDALFSLRSPPSSSAKVRRRLFRSCRGSNLCM